MNLLQHRRTQFLFSAVTLRQTNFARDPLRVMINIQYYSYRLTNRIYYCINIAYIIIMDNIFYILPKYLCFAFALYILCQLLHHTNIWINIISNCIVRARRRRRETKTVRTVRWWPTSGGMVGGWPGVRLHSYPVLSMYVRPGWVWTIIILHSYILHLTWAHQHRDSQSPTWLMVIYIYMFHFQVNVLIHELM